jgi:hypothetical protein
MPLSIPQNIEEILNSDIKNKTKMLLLYFRESKKRIDKKITGNSL